MTITKIALFKGKKIRKTIFNNEWWFSINDVISALTDSNDPAQYFKRIKMRDIELRKLAEKGGVQFVPPLRLNIETDRGKQKAYCWNTEGIFRLIQSIPSPKAEPFKMWLARVGYERVKEIEDPELGTKRTVAIYKAKGYPDSWIDKRMRGIAVRKTLTNEWEKRGAKEDIEYAILTNEIMQGAFDMSVEDYKKFKNLNRENLRDHMYDLELILTMLGEAATTKFSKDRDSRGFKPLKKDACDGGQVAGGARKDIEKRGKKPVSSQNNYKNLMNNKRKELK